MARLDALIERLVAEAASELLIASGAGVTLDTPHGPVPLIRQPLTSPQIVGAVAEILPEVEKPGFPHPVVFAYRAPAGPVDVRVRMNGAALQVRITRSRTAEPE